MKPSVDAAVHDQGVAVRNDGKSASLTAPSGLAQQGVMKAALADKGSSAAELSCMEAHGTGTKLGDPIEALALAKVHSSRSSTDTVSAASVKAMIGHLESGAGSTGLVNLVASLLGSASCPNAHLRVANPMVVDSFKGSPAVCLPTGTMSAVRKLCGGVSSFGYQGSIAHAILSRPANRAAVRSGAS